MFSTPKPSVLLHVKPFNCKYYINCHQLCPESNSDAMS